MYQIKLSTSLLRTLTICLLLACGLSSCGFKPIYAKQNEATTSEMAAISITDMKSRTGQVLKYKLKDLLNPTNIYQEPRYRLDIELKKERRELGIRDTLRVTRYDTVLTAKYKLVSLANNEVVNSGKTWTKSSYNRTTSEFSTFVAEEDSDEIAAAGLAEDLKSRLVAFLSK